MKNNFVYLLFGILSLCGCMNHELGDDNSNKSMIEWNARNVFGISFDSNHDWCTTTRGSVTVTNIPSGTQKIQVLVYVNVNDSITSLLMLNEAKINNETSVTLNYDAPNANKGIYIFDGKTFKRVNGDNVSLSSAVPQNAARNVNRAPQNNLTIASAIESYANVRGWVDGELLYELSDDVYADEAISVNDYDDEYKEVFRSVIFSYFKNGREYNNLPLVKESGYYNENGYVTTNGNGKIIVSPVYKCDKAKTYGNEIYNSDLYYYYFKETDMNAFVSNGGTVTEFLEKLPKYKALAFKQHFGETEDDNISKRMSYPLVYWGDGIPTIGTEGTYSFPSGYKIGFMVRAKTTADGGKKQGELYSDGRLNNHINSWGNFKSSKLGENAPRMGWFTLNGKTMLCFESGTDSDFNDIIVEIEGGVNKIEYNLDFEHNMYTFCFEDRELGDYDMNDVVIKATRIDETTVEYSVVACGAYDKLYVMNINGEKINDKTEIHEMFGCKTDEFINTVRGEEYAPIVERITVDKNFSFLNLTTQPYLFDATTNKNVYLSKVGEDPHGIMIPYEFKYPLEKVCIKNAYGRFNEWGAKRVTSTDWYKYYDENLVW